MSTTNASESTLGNLPQEVTSVLDTKLEQKTDSNEKSVQMTADNEVIIDKQHDTKTNEFQDNDINEDEQLNTKRSRELKLLLALSKEANLDVNISHKRKSFENLKLKDFPLMPLKSNTDNDQVLKKPKVESVEKFPITAESELETMIGECSNSLEVPITEKMKKEECKAKDTVIEERKNIKDIKMFKPNKDMFCWRCHREGVNVCCETCPRSYHQKCLKQTISDENNWPCPECVSILKAESTQTRSPAMKGMTLEHLCSLLKFAVKRMIECNGSEPFLHPVNDKDFPEYKKYIVQPMNLTLLEKNIKENLYGSTQAFEADAKWILHNSIIFNSYQSKLTTFAKTIIKICKQEMAEIENCPSCYLNANTKKSTWFVEVCPKPHILVWAKLKGFPYWPAKAMCTNSSGMVDVRFFGEHDRAWVPSKECFLYSRRDPNSNKQKRNDIIECIKEVEVYISNIKNLYGEFNYAPFKLPYDPDNEVRQLRLFMPRYKPNAPPPRKRSRLSEIRTKLPATKEDEESKDEHCQVEVKEQNQESMEGYGTDDEISERESLSINKKVTMLREDSQTPVDKEEGMEEDVDDSESEEEDEKIEPELDDDTQVSGSVSDEKLPRGNVRTRGGLNSSPGKIKIIPRRISEEGSIRVRYPAEDSPSPNKISRRNSDQSVKSDSSRLSTLSDKINRVDISENVELTLGNTADSFITSSTVDTELRKRPIQIDVDNSELSISPQNKIKITDRLMKKLSSSDEDVFNSSTDKEDSEIKSQTDIILEKYKNLVKVKTREFEIVEASTSFGSTCIPHNDSRDSKNSAEEEKKTESTEQTDMEVESRIEIAIDNSIKKDMEISNEIATSSTDNLENDIGKTEDSKENNFQEEVDLKLTKTEETVVDEKKKDERGGNIKIVRREDPKKLNEDETHKMDIIVNEIPPIEKSSIGEESKTIVSSEQNRELLIEDKLKNIYKCEEEEEKPFEVKITQKTTQHKTYAGKRSASTIEKLKGNIKVKMMDSSSSLKAKETDSKQKSKETTKIQQKKTEVKDIVSKPLKADQKVDSKKEEKSDPNGKKESQNLQQVESNSSDDQDVILDDTQIDKANIRNIIHSSLNNVERNKRRIEETTNEKETNDINDVENKDNGNDSPTLHTAKKAKVDQDPTETDLQKQNFKIVPIQSILDKTIEEPSDRSIIANNPILLKKLSQTDRLEDQQQLVCVEIKSEPESTDGEIEESEYMEKKRKYMSALNISEKTEEVAPPKKNEIRTRSKTEEMGRERQLDNLSKVIEEVATTFSAKHDSVRKNVDRKTNIQSQSNNQLQEDRKKMPVQENGEIFVKSFAKIPQQQQQQQPQQSRVSQQRSQSVQKVKPNNNFAMKTTQQQSGRRTEASSKTSSEQIPVTTLARITPAPTVVTTVAQNTPPQLPAPVHQAPATKTIESLSSSGNVLILTQPGVILPTSQQLAYNAGSFVTFVPSQQNMTMMQTPQVINAVMAPSIAQTENISQSRLPNIEMHSRSQNYISQNEEEANLNAKRRVQMNAQTAINATNNSSQIQSAHNEIPSLIPINETPGGSVISTNRSAETRSETADDEFSLLHSMVPESVSRAISEVLCRPPPKLKRRPPGPLSQVFDTGNPSAAGPVSAKINSISHRLGDYFRGMLIEMLEDLGKTNNTEATISSLKHEIETLQHKHAAEMMDIRKNVCTILKDIQGSIAEERERIIDETRSACEVEALKRIEEAKSKQWCANCGKEAQFYCCWNTSYCDYPCQQKHWSKHMNKCTQHAGQPQPSQSPAIRPQSQITFRPATPKTFTGRIVAKPAKVYLNRTNSGKSVPTFKSTPGTHLALVDRANLEFLTSTSMSAKFIASSSLFTKVKNVNSTVTSPSNSTQQPVVLNPKLNSSVSTVKPSPSTSNNVSNVISDEEMESE